MNSAIKKLVLLGALFCVAALQAAEMDHSQHMPMGHQKDHTMDHQTSMKQQKVTDHQGHQMMPHDTPTENMQLSAPLDVLDKMPESGKSREAGFEGRHIMESTDVSDSLAKRCTQASRGIIMLEKLLRLRCDDDV